MKIIVWGTGDKAEYFVECINKENAQYMEAFGKNLYEIEFFLDSNPEKADKYYLEHKIVWRDNYDFELKKYPIIVAIARNDGIIKSLNESGYASGIDVFSFGQNSGVLSYTNLGLSQLVRDMQENDDIFTAAEYDSLVKYLSKKSSDIFYYIENIFSKVICLESNAVSFGVKDIIQIYFSLIYIDVLRKKGDTQLHIYNQLKKCMSLSKAIAMLSLGYDNDIEDEVFEFCKNLQIGKLVDYRVKSIGIVYFRYNSGGVERVLSMMIPIFIKMGYPVYLITEQESDDDYEVPDGAVRINMGYRDLENDYIAWFGKLEKYVKDYNINLLYCHECYHTKFFYAQLLMRELGGVKVIGHVHGCFTFFIQGWGSENIGLCRKMYLCADKMILLSKTDVKFWRLLGCNGTYLPNPIEKIDESFHRSFEESTQNILWVGRIEQIGKRVFDCVEIMSRVVAKCPKACLFIVGKADEKSVYAELKKRIHDHGLDSNIELSGFHEDTSEFYKKCGIMLMTSISEGFSMVLAESKLYAMPTVMYEIPHLELLRDNKGFYAVRPGDYDAMADRITELISNKELREKMSKDALDSILPFKDFDFESAWRDIFDELSTNTAPRDLTEDEKDYKNIVCYMIDRFLMNVND
ncbi:MAG: glycosyltransferase [Lachnospiraceae bacterium]|nr:glycosyltransferase [Lachnospiraceae bacterium]